MEINSFLKEVEVTKTKFAKAIGMKNVSSLGRYNCIEDLLKIKRSRSIQALNILFEGSIEDINDFNAYVVDLLKNEEKKDLFKVRLTTLEHLEERSEKLSDLDVKHQIKLGNIIRNTEILALEQPDMLRELDIFLKIINNKAAGSDLSILMKYLLKMNDQMDFEDYDNSNQVNIETLVFLALNKVEREEFIEQQSEYFDALFEKYRLKVNARQELLREQNDGVRKM